MYRMTAVCMLTTPFCILRRMCLATVVPLYISGTCFARSLEVRCAQVVVLLVDTRYAHAARTTTYWRLSKQHQDNNTRGRDQNIFLIHSSSSSEQLRMHSTNKENKTNIHTPIVFRDKLPRGNTEIRTHHRHNKLYVPVCLRSILGS